MARAFDSRMAAEGWRECRGFLLAGQAGWLIVDGRFGSTWLLRRLWRVARFGD